MLALVGLAATYIVTRQVSRRRPSTEEPLYVPPELLQLVASVEPALLQDSKELVDKPLRVTREELLERVRSAAGKAGAERRGALEALLQDCFEPAGSDLELVTPPDFQPEPPGDWLPRLTSRGAREFALGLHSLWPQLTYKAAAAVSQDPGRHTLLPLPHPAVLPGARFREAYYWDSYWAVQGLLASGMRATAQGVVENLLHLVSLYGFVPNGARSYYLTRSQPPLLAAMVDLIYAATEGKNLLRRAFPLLRREHRYWTSPPKSVAVKSEHGVHLLARYYAATDEPRPESYREDTSTAAGRAGICRELATAAESGWDFSSRWMDASPDLGSTRATRTVPADLNALLYRTEQLLARFAEVLGHKGEAARFAKLAEERRAAMMLLMYSSRRGCWLDLVLEGDPASGPVGAQQAPGGFAACYIPLWAGLAAGDAAVTDALVVSLELSGLLQAGGLAASLEASGQQWDWPNAWPPLQALVAEGLLQHGGEAGRRLGAALVQAFLHSCHRGWREGHRPYLLEKYSATAPGGAGQGGEYAVQRGFAWTIGAALHLMAQHGFEVEEQGSGAARREGSGAARREGAEAEEGLPERGRAAQRVSVPRLRIRT